MLGNNHLSPKFHWLAVNAMERLTPILNKRPESIVHQPDGISPGVCTRGGESQGCYGFFVKYQSVRTIGCFSDLRQALLSVFVTELSGRRVFAGDVPFLIDSGAPTTIIPRRLVTPNAFPLSRTSRLWHVLIKAAGGSFCGHCFRASLALRVNTPGIQPLLIGGLNVLVPDVWANDYGILGLDALRRLRVVFEAEQVVFWPSQAGRNG